MFCTIHQKNPGVFCGFLRILYITKGFLYAKTKQNRKKMAEKSAIFVTFPLAKKLSVFYTKKTRGSPWSAVFFAHKGKKREVVSHLSSCFGLYG